MWACVSSAPGKVILFGEHAVVAGEPALATCVSLRTHCGASRSAGEEVVLRLETLGQTEVRWERKAVAELLHEGETQLNDALSDRLAALARAGKGTESVDARHSKALEAFLLAVALSEACGETGLEATVWSELPVGAGLGSSAAFGVAVIGAMAHLAGRKWCSSPEPSCASCDQCRTQLNAWAFECERVLHGNPSGVDNSVAVFGGALSFVRGQPLVRLHAMPELPLLLADTQVPRSTQLLVAGVTRRRQVYPETLGPVLTATGALTRRAAALLEGGGEDRAALLAELGELVQMNQGLLECMGVSHPSLRAAIDAVAPHAAKLTGAGGGGCLFVLLGDATETKERETMCGRLKELGCRVYPISVGGDGLTVQFNQPRKS